MAELQQGIPAAAIADAAIEVVLCALPIWGAAMVGLVIGWAWRPRWTGLLVLGLRSRARLLCTLPPGLGARRLWIAFTALSAFSVCRRLWGNFRWKGAKEEETTANPEPMGDRGLEPCGPVDGISVGDQEIISNRDLEHLLHLLDGKDGDSFWQNMMERTTSTMGYQAWHHEPEVGPIMYRSRTVFEDATPEIVRDFFWDDEFRTKWDNMLAFGKILEAFPPTGEMIVHWIKKFPFFCSDREYIIGRRIWESGRTYYCVTKGVPYPALPKKVKPRRVDLYFSSWRIRAVESLRQDGQLTACEVTLIHYEDMGIPKDVAKVGVRHGMWGTVKRLQSGMRAYQQARKSNMPLSRTALMAQNMTKISALGLTGLFGPESSDVEDDATKDIGTSRKEQGIDWRLILIGGSVAVACGLQTGIIGKALLLGAARRLQRK